MSTIQISRNLFLVFTDAFMPAAFTPLHAATVPAPSPAPQARTIPIPGLNSRNKSIPWTVIVLFTVLTLLPALLLSMTPFVRILIVFHFLRQALGTQTPPTNHTLIGLALFLMYFVMQPVGLAIDKVSVEPFTQGSMTVWHAVERSASPMRKFMLKYTREKYLALFAAELSVFSTLLLFLTLFRISLNIASSRQILLHGNEGPTAAGSVIALFGQFVVGGNYVVGFVIFIALISIQYLVINHGAVRTAEVAARFTLDAMPGKQMAIDADLNAGTINEQEARARRVRIAQEAEFYGAMDGAARFKQRDAMATVLITIINIFAGFLIGVFQLNIPFQDALKTYTILTVGDGLVTMIPSLLVSVAGGPVVTRASYDKTIGVDFAHQLSKKWPLRIASGVMFLLAAFPGLPKLSFLLAGAVVGWLSTRAPDGEVAVTELTKDASGKSKEPTQRQQLEGLLKLNEIHVEVGYALVPLVDQSTGGQLLQRIRALRRHLATQLGFLVPSVHIMDNIRLKPREYVAELRGVEVARYEMAQDRVLAISSDPHAAPLEGIETREPAFGVAAKWIEPRLQEKALASGYAVVDQTSIFATHVAEIVRQHAHELQTRQETKRLLDALVESHPKLVEELVPRLLSIGEMQRVLQLLLHEQVSIRDLPAILETLLDNAAINKNPVHLVETVRQSLGRSVVTPHRGTDRKLRVLTLDPAIEDELTRSLEAPAAIERTAAAATLLLRRLLDGLQRLVGDPDSASSTIVLCHSPARFHFRRLLEPFLPRVVVLAPEEIPPGVTVQSLGVIR